MGCTGVSGRPVGRNEKARTRRVAMRRHSLRARTESKKCSMPCDALRCGQAVEARWKGGAVAAAGRYHNPGIGALRQEKLRD
jgi:hypothetical protein